MARDEEDEDEDAVVAVVVVGRSPLDDAATSCSDGFVGSIVGEVGRSGAESIRTEVSELRR